MPRQMVSESYNRSMSTPAEPASRVFFALVPPPEVQQALGKLAREIARRAHGRPVPADNMHVTLAFIGAWPVARLQLLLDTGAVVRGERLHIVLDKQGGFRRAGIAWMGPSDPPAALMRLQASLAAALTNAGVPFDASQSFNPHVTLARSFRGPCPRGETSPIAFDVDRFSLMLSETRQEGARYRKLNDWPLA